MYPQLKIVLNLKEGLQEKSKLAQYAYEEARRVGWKLKVTAGIEIQGIGPYGMLNQSDQHFTHLDPPHQQ
jgi:hypothetical protein